MQAPPQARLPVCSGRICRPPPQAWLTVCSGLICRSHHRPGCLLVQAWYAGPTTGLAACLFRPNMQAPTTGLAACLFRPNMQAPPQAGLTGGSGLICRPHHKPGCLFVHACRKIVRPYIITVWEGGGDIHYRYITSLFSRKFQNAWIFLRRSKILYFHHIVTKRLYIFAKSFATK